MNEQPTAGQYQSAYEQVTGWQHKHGDPMYRLIGATIDILGFDVVPEPRTVAVVRQFLGSELAAKLGTPPPSERPCGYCEGTGQVEFCDDVCQCGPSRCATCDGTGVLQ